MSGKADSNPARWNDHTFGAALAYVERNPVRAGMVAAAAEWPWSNASAHLNILSAHQWLPMETWRENWSPETWPIALAQGLDEAAVLALRAANLQLW